LEDALTPNKLMMAIQFHMMAWIDCSTQVAIANLRPYDQFRFCLKVRLNWSKICLHSYTEVWRQKSWERFEWSLENKWESFWCVWRYWTASPHRRTNGECCWWRPLRSWVSRCFEVCFWSHSRIEMLQEVVERQSLLRGEQLR
jgi:hypothetical protein